MNSMVRVGCQFWAKADPPVRPTDMAAAARAQANLVFVISSSQVSRLMRHTRYCEASTPQVLSIWYSRELANEMKDSTPVLCGTLQSRLWNSCTFQRGAHGCWKCSASLAEGFSQAPHI